jgi:hypothetical protein
MKAGKKLSIIILKFLCIKIYNFKKTKLKLPLYHQQKKNKYKNTYTIKSKRCWELYAGKPVDRRQIHANL